MKKDGCARNLLLISGPWSLFIVLMVSLFLPVNGHAFFEDVYVSGLVSQGYFKATEYDHIIANSAKGTAEFNEAILTVMALPAERVRIGIQVIARDAGDIGNNNVLLDWAFGDYRWRDWLGFRAGKIKMKMGLYNMGQDVDMLRTTVYLPQSAYSVTWRDYALAHEGISIYGNHDIGALGNLEFEGYIGALNVPNPEHSSWAKSFDAGGMIGYEDIESSLSDSVNYEFLRTEGINVDFPWTGGGAVTWNTPLNGLLLFASVNMGEYDFSFHSVGHRYDIDPTSGEVLSTSLQNQHLISNGRYAFAMFSLEYNWKEFIFSSELSRFFNENENQINQGVYAMLTWEPNQHYSLAGYVSEFLPDMGDRDGKKLKNPWSKDFHAWQREAVIAARVNVTSNWLIKAEFHMVDGIGQVVYSREADASESRYSNMFALKTTFHF